MTTEVFAENRAVTTVSSGGTDAPAAGTVETWTVASSAMFPAASSSAAPPAQFHVSDPAAPSEMIAVTAVSGTTWTVTRGAESTTPVTHSAGFTVYQVVTTGGLKRFYQQPYSLNAWGGDPTGAGFSDGAMGSILTAMGTAPGIITATAGTYKCSGFYQFGPGQGIATGLDLLAVVFEYTGGGVFITSHDPDFDTSNSSPLASVCGPMTGFTIDGTSAGSAATGIRLGDQNLIDVNVGVQNFAGAAATGGHIACQVGWINYGHVTISTDNCTNHVVFDGSGVEGGTALGGVNWTFYQTANPNQNGVVAKGTCQTVGGTFQLFGEYLGGTANTGSVFLIGEADSSGFTNFTEFNVNAESNSGSGDVAHTSITLGENGYFYSNTGQLIFRNPGSAAFQASSGLSGSQYFGFDGFVLCETSGDFLGDPYAGVGAIGWAGVTKGVKLEQLGAASSGQIYVWTGTVFPITLASGSNTYAPYGSAPGYGQRIRLLVHQPSSGSAGTLTLTGVKTPGGAGLTLTTGTATGKIDSAEMWYDGTSWYATVQGLNYS